MRKLMFIILSLIFVVVSINAQGSGIGVGLSTSGISSGLCGKYWMGGSSAIAVQVGLPSSLDVDYLLHKPDMLKLTDAPTPIYYGLGIGISSSENDAGDSKLGIGVRGIIGISYYVSAYPLDIFIESTPTIGIVGDSNFGGSFGFRYFF